MDGGEHQTKQMHSINVSNCHLAKAALLYLLVSVKMNAKALFAQNVNLAEVEPQISLAKNSHFSL
jgi:hypothetical protein